MKVVVWLYNEDDDDEVGDYTRIMMIFNIYRELFVRFCVNSFIYIILFFIVFT